LVLAGGCGSYQFPAYPAKSCLDCASHSEAGGVAIGADPIFDSSVSRQYFDRDLPSAGILPVYVVVQNVSHGKAILVDREQFTVRGTTAVQDVNAVTSGSESTGKALALVGAGGVLGLVGAGMYVDARNVDANFQRQFLEAQTVSPGESSSGFVYFNIASAAGNRPGQWVVHAQLQEAGTSNLVPIEVTISNNRR
jgi:hypothetical protein